MVRQKLQQILTAEQALPDSHDFREIEAIFEAMPKTELFLLGADELRAEIRTVRSLGAGDGVRVRFRPHGRGVWVTTILPRERFSGEVRDWIERLLAEHLGGPVVDYQLSLGEGEQASPSLLRRAGRQAAGRRRSDRATHRRARSFLGRSLARAPDRGLSRACAAARSPSATRPLHARTTRRQPRSPAAFNDIRHLEALTESAPVGIELANAVGRDADRFTLLKLYLRGEGIVLSDFLPLLENLGLRVFAEDSVALGEGEGRIVLVRFLVQDLRGQRARRQSRGADARAGDPRDPRRTGGERLAEPTGRRRRLRLARGRAAAHLPEPRLPGGRGAEPAGAERGAAATRRGGAGALRSVRGALRSRRAGAGEPGAGGPRAILEGARERGHGERGPDAPQLRLADRGHVAHQLLPPAVDPIIRSSASKCIRSVSSSCPSPARSTRSTCTAPRMEGLHLRGGKVARGGIRCSDRPDDFRAEILGLMKTQMVKNAVIVPVGSKGGFVVKRAKAGAEGAAEVRECYSTLMRGLLDLTDNIVRRRDRSAGSRRALRR